MAAKDMEDCKIADETTNADITANASKILTCLPCGKSFRLDNDLSLHTKSHVNPIAETNIN